MHIEVNWEVFTYPIREKHSVFYTHRSCSGTSVPYSAIFYCVLSARHVG